MLYNLQQNMTKTLETEVISKMIETPCSIAYKVGNNFEILNYLDLSRKDNIWGYEIKPGVIIACKGNTLNINNWLQAKEFAEKSQFKNKKGKLPNNLSINIDIIREMDAFLNKHNIDTDDNNSTPYLCIAMDRLTGFNVYIPTSKMEWNIPRWESNNNIRVVVEF